ncbi:DUF6879 family protein [Streptomyces sp. NPDC093224]|uniref:DUF6879 family protein n=1 Tax=Streptomyces sp. NPDC093224 TaxID=3155198 RepID=UPI00343419CE
MMSSKPTFDELMPACSRAYHLEVCASCAVGCEAGPFADWRAGYRHDPANRGAWWRPWLDLVSGAVRRGVVLRLARIVSEPVSEYTRFLCAGTFTNVAAGEQVRWLVHRRASDIALPGNDFWLFDGEWVGWDHSAGGGPSLGEDITNDLVSAELCTQALDSVGARAIPHSEYKI